MPIRITGMNSGLDTESIITALTQRYEDKVTTHTNNQKKLTWKQEKWQDLNKKAVKFYNGMLSTMRFSTAYTQKTTTASNTTAVSVVTGSDAMIANQSLDITSLAKSAYLTGDKVTTSDGSAASADATMEELGLSSGTINFSIGSDDSKESVSVDIESTDTISDVLTKLKNASTESGKSLNFNYDENNNRFYVAAKSEGDSYNFEFEDSDITQALGLTSSNYVEGTSAAITLNGVDYTSDSNTFEINGLTITANEVASGITLTTKQDTSGIYDNIKTMISEYNDLMKEFATVYNADKATKYSMLTDDQKEEMSDDEIEEWENKIKEGLLSGDETVANIRNGLKSIVNSTFDITLSDGTTESLSLASFGIATGSYFSTDEDERDLLHIDGDSDDSTTSGNTDLLSAAISSDPDKVQAFFTKFSQALYGKMSDLMARTEYSSAFTIYEDKLMASQYSAYTTKIADAQEALEAAQDRYYSKFTAMETALAKINSSSSTISSFFSS